MLHRHLTHQNFTLAAIDEVIDRGGKEDWFELRRALLTDPATADRLLRVCAAHVSDPYAQRYPFWLNDAEHAGA